LTNIKEVELLAECINLLRCFAGIVKNIDSMTETERESLVKVAVLYKCKELETVVQNVRNDEDFLNPSIGTFLNDETGRKLKELFFQQSTLADVIFNVEG
jgi:hypothetical protein